MSRRVALCLALTALVAAPAAAAPAANYVPFVQAGKILFVSGQLPFSDGKLAVTEDSRIEGDGVTFFLDGLVSIVELAPDAVISLAAPTDGSMAGILFYQNRNFGGVHKWDSRNVRRLFGTVYVPTGVVRATSDATVTPRNSCSVIIAARLDLGRNSRISIDLTSSACKQYLASPFRRAVALLD